MQKLPEYSTSDSLIHNLSVKVDANLMRLVKETADKLGFDFHRDYVKALLNAHGKGLLSIKGKNESEISPNPTDIETLQNKQIQIDSLEIEVQRLKEEKSELLKKIDDLQSESNRNLIGIQSESNRNPPYINELSESDSESDSDSDKPFYIRDADVKPMMPIDADVTKTMPMPIDADARKVMPKMEMADSDIPEGIPADSFRAYVRRLEDDRVKLQSALETCHTLFFEAQKKGDYKILLFQSEMAIYSIAEYVKIHFEKFFPPHQAKDFIFESVRQSYPLFPRLTADPYHRV